MTFSEIASEGTVSLVELLLSWWGKEVLQPLSFKQPLPSVNQVQFTVHSQGSGVYSCLLRFLPAPPLDQDRVPASLRSPSGEVVKEDSYSRKRASKALLTQCLFYIMEVML